MFTLEASSVGGNLVKEVFKSGIPRLCLGSPPELLLCVSCLFLCILCSDEETLPRSSVHFALSGHLYMFPSPHHLPASGPGMWRMMASQSSSNTLGWKIVRNLDDRGKEMLILDFHILHHAQYLGDCVQRSHQEGAMYKAGIQRTAVEIRLHLLHGTDRRIAERHVTKPICLYKKRVKPSSSCSLGVGRWCDWIDHLSNNEHWARGLATKWS